MAKTNKQLQAEIDELIIERNNLIDTVEILEKGIKRIAKMNGQDRIAEVLDNIEDDVESVVDWVEHSFKQRDSYFQDIMKYEKELEKQDKEIEELKEENHDLDTMLKNAMERIKELEEQNFGDYGDGWRSKQAEYIGNQFKEVRKQLSKKQNTIVLSNKQNQDLFDALQKELQSQIILKNTYKKENKRLKKRRREGRYNPKKVYEKLAKGRLCYIPEGDYLPTKVHESLIDAMEEGHRLADKTKNTVYIVGTYCKI